MLFLSSSSALFNLNPSHVPHVDLSVGCDSVVPFLPSLILALLPRSCYGADPEPINEEDDCVVY
eukprot:3624342-Rhodomonas_salina.1